jgi:hypothetical protein
LLVHGPNHLLIVAHRRLEIPMPFLGEQRALEDVLHRFRRRKRGRKHHQDQREEGAAVAGVREVVKRSGDDAATALAPAGQGSRTTKRASVHAGHDADKHRPSCHGFKINVLSRIASAFPNGCSPDYVARSWAYLRSTTTALRRWSWTAAMLQPPERFSRKKHDPRFPCWRSTTRRKPVCVDELDYVAFTKSRW